MTAKTMVEPAVTTAPARTPLVVTVTAKRLIGTMMARITFTGEVLGHFGYDGPDHLARLFLPSASGRLVLPVTTEWWPEMRAMPLEDRPILRNYTARRLDRARQELDIDFVLHGDGSPASAWALRAAPGDQIGVLSDGAEYAPPADTDWQLIAGDVTAIPAVSSIVERFSPGTRAVVLLEVTDAADEVDIAAPDGVDIRWLHRQGTGPRGARVVEALRSTDFPVGDVYAWVAGESTLATSVRRYLVKERHIAKSRIYFCGYWRVGSKAY
ncbi:MAG: siderophore-interacting protein [Actinomycetota bacterium]|nr:siderophore-interacting protein [Actinomycetota bacterium]